MHPGPQVLRKRTFTVFVDIWVSLNTCTIQIHIPKILSSKIGWTLFNLKFLGLLNAKHGVCSEPRVCSEAETPSTPEPVPQYHALGV